MNRDDRSPVQPGAGSTPNTGGVTGGQAPVTGTATLTTGGVVDGFNFSSLSVVDDGAADIQFEINILFPIGNARIQAAAGNFDSITEAPLSGYGTDAVDVTTPGTVYVFTTNTGLFGKMEVLTFGGGNMSFRYAVQNDGSRYLANS